MQIKGVMGFGKKQMNNDQGHLCCNAFSKLRCGIRFKTWFSCLVGPLTVNKMLTVGPKIIVLEQ